MASAVYACNTAVRAAVRRRQADVAISIFSKMCRENLRPNHITFILLTKACSMLSDHRLLLNLHGFSLKLPISSDLYLQTAFTHVYSIFHNFDSALMVFDEIQQKDISSWNVILSACAACHVPHSASILLREMLLSGVRPDQVTLITLSRFLVTGHIMAVHCVGLSIGMISDVSVANTLVSAYSKSGDLYSAMAVFSGINTSFRTIVSWNSVIFGCSFCRNFDSALYLYVDMLREGLRPDASTILGLLSSCGKGMGGLQGRMVHCHGVKEGCDIDLTVLNTIMWMYVKCGEITYARCLFETMGENRTSVSWSILIDGYTKEGDMDEAVCLFNSMLLSGKNPDNVVVVSLLTGCGVKGDLDLGLWLDSFVSSNGMKRDVVVCNALMDMYGKCGEIENAREIFHMMCEKTVVSWTTMIMGCALNGEFMEAYHLFVSMRRFGFRPNCVTFLAVLQGCSHAGMLEQGRECFHLMRNVYGIEPGLGHYSCMVTLLGRNGRLKEALEVVKIMPVEPDSGIWGTLICACKLHGDVELGELVSRRLLELEPRTAASYVEMSNLYAFSHRWDGVARTRKVMRMSGVQKFPGQSMIHLGGGSQVFTAEQIVHPKFSFVHDFVGTLNLHMRMDGDDPCFEEFMEFDLD